MSRIRELYIKAGSPDLSHWKDIHLFSLAESALLTVGIDPLMYEDRTLKESLITILKTEKPVNWQYALMIVRALRQAICLDEINCKIAFIEKGDFSGQVWEEKINQLELTLEHLDILNTHSTKISRMEYRRWLDMNGYLTPPQQQENLIIEQSQSERIPPINRPDNNIIYLPEPTYTTDPLEAVNGVIREFWIDYDPEKNQPPPKQAIVIAWIEKHHPKITGNDLRLYIDKICRHHTAKRGGNKKTNQ